MALKRVLGYPPELGLGDLVLGAAGCRHLRDAGNVIGSSIRNHKPQPMAAGQRFGQTILTCGGTQAARILPRRATVTDTCLGSLQTRPTAAHRAGGRLRCVTCSILVGCALGTPFVLNHLYRVDSATPLTPDGVRP